MSTFGHIAAALALILIQYACHLYPYFSLSNTPDNGEQVK